MKFLRVILGVMLICSSAAAQEGLSLRFLGTGAADWTRPDRDGSYRRTTSVLLDDAVLIDFNACNADMIPENGMPEVAFYTHSHPDHYNAEAALRQGLKRVYVGDSWADRAERDFAEASRITGLPAPEIIPIAVGEKVCEHSLNITALPANHATGHLDELALIFLVEKGEVRLLYATDTGGIMAVAARLAGIDAHAPGKPLTALVMEATMGADYDEDFRIYTHSSVGTVLRTVHVLQKTGRLVLPEGGGVYLTHLARTLHGSRQELDRTLPAPLKAAYDGLEVIVSR